MSAPTDQDTEKTDAEMGDREATPKVEQTVKTEPEQEDDSQSPRVRPDPGSWRGDGLHEVEAHEPQHISHPSVAALDSKSSTSRKREETVAPHTRGGTTVDDKAASSKSSRDNEDKLIPIAQQQIRNMPKNLETQWESILAFVKTLHPHRAQPDEHGKFWVPIFLWTKFEENITQKIDEDQDVAIQRESNFSVLNSTRPWNERFIAAPILRSEIADDIKRCLLYTSPSPRDQRGSRMPSCG